MFGQFPSVRIDASNLLEARMIVTTYNQHVRLLSSEPFGCFALPKSTRAWEPTLFMESLRSKPPRRAARPALGGEQTAQASPVFVGLLCDRRAVPFLPYGDPIYPDAERHEPSEHEYLQEPNECVDYCGLGVILLAQAQAERGWSKFHPSENGQEPY
jgi:hypothetical protein